MPNLLRFDDPEIFYTRIEPYLLPHEAEHNLTFGLMAYLRQDRARFADRVMALVEDQGAVQLVGLQTDPNHGLTLSLAAAPEAITLLAKQFHAAGMTFPGVNAPAQVSDAFAQEWTRLTGKTAHLVVPLRTFKLEKVEPVTGVPGHLRRATPDDRDLLARWELAFMREALPEETATLADAEATIDLGLTFDQRGLYVWDDGGAVSYTAYKGPTLHGMRIGPVYTPPELRGRGYASACVAGVSQMLLDAGRQFCFLFTDLRNPTSNHIYQVIGYQPICDFNQYGFED